MKYYTCEAIELPQEILEIPYAYTASCKNIYNASLCIIKNLANSYDKYVNNQEISYILKANLLATIKKLNIISMNLKYLVMLIINFLMLISLVIYSN